jgi:hypothetical protein
MEIDSGPVPTASLSERVDSWIKKRSDETEDNDIRAIMSEPEGEP